jgi:hypothetical protein
MIGHNDWTYLGAFTAAGAFLQEYGSGLLGQGDVEITGLAANFLQFGEGVDFDVGVPADLDQLGGDNSHGAVVGGKGLVDLGHVAADGRTLLHQVDVVA